MYPAHRETYTCTSTIEVSVYQILYYYAGSIELLLTIG